MQQPTVICPFCGAATDANQPFCAVCGARLPVRQPGRWPVSPPVQQPAQQPQQPPAAPGGAPRYSAPPYAPPYAPGQGYYAGAYPKKPKSPAFIIAIVSAIVLALAGGLIALLIALSGPGGGLSGGPGDGAGGGMPGANGGWGASGGADDNGGSPWGGDDNGGSPWEGNNGGNAAVGNGPVGVYLLAEISMNGQSITGEQYNAQHDLEPNANRLALNEDGNGSLLWYDESNGEQHFIYGRWEAGGADITFKKDRGGTFEMRLDGDYISFEATNSEDRPVWMVFRRSTAVEGVFGR